MEDYEEFKRFVDSLIAGTNAIVSGCALNFGFARGEEGVGLAPVYSASLKIAGSGSFPEPVNDQREANKIFALVKGGKFRLDHVDLVMFTGTTVGDGSRWQLRFRE